MCVPVQLCRAAQALSRRRCLLPAVLTADDCRCKAAVKEAEGWLGGGAGLLGRARTLGPHPFATLRLPAPLAGGKEGHPVARTPFQVCARASST